MITRELPGAVANLQQAHASMPANLDGIRGALGDLDHLLGILSEYSRRLSSAARACLGAPRSAW